MMSNTLRNRLTMFLPGLLGLLVLVTLPARAQFAGLGTGPVTVTLEASATQASPGDKVVLAIKVDISDEVDANGKHWHIYPPKPVHTGVEVASTVKPALPEGWVVGEVQWPKPVQVENAFGKLQPAYDGQVVIYVPLIVSKDAQPGEVKLAVEFGYQACNSSCIAPTSEKLETTIKIVKPDPAANTPDNNTPDNSTQQQSTFQNFDPAIWDKLKEGQGVFTEQTSSSVPLDVYIFEIDLSKLGPVALLGLLVGVSLLGGFLLNFTPCVLPVIPLKIMGLSQSAGSRGRTLFLGVVMFAGVLAFWAVFGVFFALLKQIEQVGELFQEWWFTIGVGVIVAAMAVGMCGLFAVRLPQWVYRIQPKHDSVAGSFGFGIMTAVLATPCTAPFMGTALAGSTQLEKDWLVMAVFIAIGVGMGLPYLVLAAFPQMVAKVPRTGPGSELLKQVMGLLMLAAAAFFIGTGLNVVMSDGTEAPSKLFWWAVGLLVVASGLWLVWGINKLNPTFTRRVVFSVLGLLLVLSGAAGSVILTRKPPIAWVYYTPQLLEIADRNDQVVVLDFTAAWCNNCHFLEETVLNTQAVADLLNSEGVVAMKVDITSKENINGLKLLTHFGGKQIPLLVVLSPDGEVVFKRDWYGPSEVIDAVGRARGEKVAQR